MTDNVVQYKKRSLVRIEPITKDVDEALNKSLPLLKTSIEAYGRNVDPEEVIEDILDQNSLLWHVYLEDPLIAAFPTVVKHHPRRSPLFIEFMGGVDMTVWMKAAVTMLSSFGYDARVSDEFKIFTNVNSEIVDPKNFKPTNFVTKNVSECIIPPNSFVLARTVEKFKIPNDVLVICLGKSTYARCGIIVNVTPLEPGWEGYVTLEFSNTTPLPAKIYANEGVAQFIFLKGNEKPEVTYADRNGKYMARKLL